jgi:hypothetical protein
LQVGALACVAIAYAKRNDVAVEGAYFNRSSGKAVAVGVFPGGAPTPWLAAAVLLIAAAAAFLVDHKRRQ